MRTGGLRRWTAGRAAKGGLAVALLAALALAAHAALAAPAAPTARAAPVARATAVHGAPARAAAASEPVMTIHTDELAGPPYMGLGVEFDPYDPIVPTQAQWDRIFQRVDFMQPGFIRVVEAAYDYFGGYDANHNPTYRWNAPLVREMLTILSYAKSRGITVVLGDWENPMIGGDPRIPADFLEQLRDVYGFTNIRYYNLISEPNLDTGCDFGCWAGIVKALSSQFASMGLNKWLQLVGPDNANNYDDMQGVQAYDRTNGLDTDAPNGGDSWVTMTLQSVPSLIGAYDSHRYATPWGTENGVYEDQMRARREEISNLDSPSKPYFAGELGLVTATPQSQPAIGDFSYGVSMADLMIQATDAGMSGASAWDLDDAMHNKGPYGSDDLKQWGFWNSLGGQDGYPASDLSLRPWYYTWSVLSRSFPAGSQPLAVPSSGIAGLRVAAAKIPRPGGYALSFAVVNDSDTPQSITLSVPSATGPLTLAQYDYFDGERPTDAQGFPVPSQILPDTWLARGVRVALPSRGVVVLSSVDVGSPSAVGTSVGLNDGTRTLLDDLNDWHETAAHSAGLTLDHSNPALFNDDTSRAASATASPEYLTYRANQVTSFELKAYYQGTPGLRAYGSEDGATWTRIPLAATNPAPALGGGGSYLAELFPNGGLPAGTNELKIELTDPRTELSQALIQYARVGPACTQPPRQVRGNDVVGVRLGTSRRTVISLLGTPSTSGAQASRYCVVGGGQLAFVFSQRNQVALIASTAPSYRPGGIGPGSSLDKLQHTLHRRLRGVGGGVFIARLRRTTVVVLARRRSVRAVAVATRAVLDSGPAAAAAIELAING